MIYYNKNGNYAPRLTITTRKARTVGKYPVDIDLKIEFSVPKLIHQNNIDELTDKDFPEVISMLQNKLSAMGIEVSKDVLTSASVSQVHFSKNIPITNYYTATAAIKELSKLDTNKRLEVNEKRFQDTGHALYFDNNSYSMVFYDKVRDIPKNKRHSVDKEKTAFQMKLFDNFKETKKSVELLRYELRLTKKWKLNSLMKELGYPENPTFKDVFSSELSQKMLQKHWELIFPVQSKFMLKFDEDDPTKMFENIVSYYKGNRKRAVLRESLALFGITYLTKTEGMRSVKKSISKAFSDRTWYRAKKWFNTANLLFLNSSSYEFVKDIEDTLKSFTPVSKEALL